MKTIRVFISSPGDVGRERELTRRIIARVEASFGRRVKLEPYLWEHEPMRGTADFQQNIQDPAEFDIVVCILWSRLGSRLHSQHQRPDGTTYASGTEYEFERAVEGFRLRGSPDLLIYRRQELPLLPPEPKEKLLELSNQWEALKAFCERWFKDVREGTFSAAYNSYTNLSEFEEHFEKHLRKIVTEKLARDPKSGSVVSAGLIPTWKGKSPYRGLKVFDFEHEAIFFGRTKSTDDILGALRKRAIEDNCPFVLILGASGSGKSSLLRAGVLPLLVRPGVIDGIGLWRRLVLRPSEAVGDLFKGFAVALLSSSALPELGTDGTTADQLAKMMRQAPAGVGLLLKEALSRAAREMQLAEKLECQPVARLAVALDQLEELFTDSRLDSEQRRTFFQAITILARSGYAWVVATLRSDFYHRCEELPELVELTRGAGQYHLLPPTAAELGQMIRLPAEAAGRRFEDHPEKGRLDDLIRDTALREAGALPLLEFALDELYRGAQSGSELTHADYEKIGGVEGALAKQADKRFEDLSEEARQAFEPVFQRLVSLGKMESTVAQAQTDGLAAVRQTVSLEEVRACSPGAAELVDGLIAGRLLVTDRAKEGGTVVTVSHEALLRSWGRLRQWIADHREMLELRVEVASAEDAWRRAGRKVDYLLVAGLPLEKARQVQAAGFLNEAQNEFVNASVNKAKRRTRLVLATVSALLLVFVCLSVFALSAVASTIAAPKRDSTIIYRQLSFYHQIEVQDIHRDGDTFRYLLLDSGVEGGMTVPKGYLLLPYQRYWQLALLNRDLMLKHALFIGGGAFGMPEHAATLGADVQVDVVEVDPVVIALGRRFFKLDEFPNVRAYPDDARRLLRTTSEKYDLIFGDAYNGVRHIPAHLVTREFFEEARSKLTDNGVFLINIISGVQGERAALLSYMLATLRTVFPTVEVFAVSRSWREPVNVILLGSMKSWKPWLEDRSYDPNSWKALLVASRIAPPLLPKQRKVFTDDWNPIDTVIAKQLLK